MEYEVTVDLSDHGYEPKNGERLLTGFMKTHPETDPVVSQSTETGVLSVLFAFTPEQGTVDGFEQAVRMFSRGAEAAGLAPAEILSFHVDLVRDEEHREEREPALA